MSARSLATFLTRLIWLSLLPLLLLAVWMAYDRVRTDRIEMAQAAERRLSNFQARIDGFLEARILALDMLANSPLADTPQHWSALYAEAQAFRTSFGSHVIFADRERQMLFNTRLPLGTALPRLPLPRGRSAATLALDSGRPAVGDLVVGPTINEPLVAIAVPGLRAGAVRHLMLVTTTTRELQQQIDAIALQPGWALTLADSTGEIIARQAPPGFESARDVDPRWRFAGRLKHAQWTLRLEVPRAVQRQPLLESALTMALAILLATFAGMLGGHLIARRLRRQVAELSGPASTPPDIAEIAAVRRRLDAGLAELRASEASHRAMFEANPHPMWVYDLETLAFLAVNDAAINKYGYSRAEFLAMTIRDIRPPEDVPRLLENVSRVDGGLDTAGLWHHRTKDGQLLTVEISSHVLQFAGRRAELVLVHDVTARQQAEEALRQRNAELERFDRASIGRELAMVELKRQINVLARELGRAPPYDLDRMDEPGTGERA